jgi:CubicO group peptidase (beta-lactamase class C family)
MRITRRGCLGATAAVAGASFADTTLAEGARPSAPATSSGLPTGAFRLRTTGSGHDYAAALEALRAYAIAELAAEGLPGMTLSVTDVDGFTAVLALGWADVDRRVPVDPGHYFQIGSISKSFIALTVLALADEGKIDLDAPLARYLPDAALPAEPITVAQVLSHTSGLPDDAALFPRTPDGRLWCGFKPGAKFSYSNTGYNLLGRLVERATGLPHKAAVAEFVRDKVGVAGMAGTISQAVRPDFAVGYWPWDQTAAALPGARLSFASWNEEDNPAGPIGATSDQMAAYLRALMHIARGEGRPVLSDAAAKRFAAPVIPTDEFGPGAQYACGVAIAPIDGAPCLHHTGGMMSFSSSFHADPAAGVACFASVNARLEGYRPRQTTAFAVRLMRAARAGKPLPAAPDPLAPHRFKDPAPFVGRFVADGADFTLAVDQNGMRLTAAEKTFRALPQGPDRLITDHPKFARYGLDVVRENGKVVAFWWGETLFGRDAPRPTPPPADRLRPFGGVYLNRDPWIGGATVLVRGDTLVVDGLGPLADRGGWWSLEKDPGGVERLRFDGLLNGKAQRLNVSGDDLLRIEV